MATTAAPPRGNSIAPAAPSSKPRTPYSWRTPLCIILAALMLAAVGGWALLPPQVWVLSEPPGAAVYVDGREAGHTPLLVSAPGDAIWQLRVEAPGYAPWHREAHIAPRGFTRFVATLAPLPGSLRIESEPAGAVVHIGDRDAGTTPYTAASLAPGSYRLRVSAPDYEDWSADLRIPPGGEVAERIVLRPLPATVVIFSPFDHSIAANLMIDGQPRGRLPIELKADVGDRVVRVEADGYRPWEQVLHLSPNERRSVEALLQRPWPTIEGEPVYALAAMIENQEDSRPQTGLDRADVVYEALAEGGITRFLAVYATQDADVLGPVRSARHYFVLWAREYGAPLVHIGASPQGYAAIAQIHLSTVDDMKGDPGFWRSAARRAPHNAYASTPVARDDLGGRGAQPGSFGGLHYKKDATRLLGASSTQASITYEPWGYTVAWNYDPYWNEYTRTMDGIPHLDACTGEQLRAENVLIQWVDSWLIPEDSEGRLDFAQVGSGQLIALIDGVQIAGRWSKRSLDAATEYRDTAGNFITLNAGPTWIEILPEDAVFIS